MRRRMKSEVGVRKKKWMIVLAAVFIGGFLAIASLALASPAERTAVDVGKDRGVPFIQISEDLKSQSLPSNVDEATLKFSPRTIYAEPRSVSVIQAPEGFERKAGEIAPQGGGPSPLDAPFGANVPVWTDAASQQRVGIAADSTGSLYAVFEHTVTPTNRDIYVAKSVDGVTWGTPVGLGTEAYDERSPTIAITSTDMIVVMWGQTNPATNQIIYYSYSTNGGATWNLVDLDLTGFRDGRDFINPSLYALGTGLYSTQQFWCIEPVDCGGGASSIIWWYNFGAGWYGVYFVTPPDFELFRPVVSADSRYMYVATEMEVVDNFEYDALWFWADPSSGFPLPVTDSYWALLGGRAGGRDPINIALEVSEPYVTVGASISNVDLLGTTNHIIVAVQSSDSGYNYQGVNDNNLLLDPWDIDQNHLSIDGVGYIFHAVYRRGTDAVYKLSVTGGFNWYGPLWGDLTGDPYRISDNAGAGTVVTEFRAMDVVYSKKVRVVWEDNRVGNNEIFYSGTAGYSLYILTKDPLYGSVTVNGSPYPAPYAAIWPIGSTQTAEVPPSEQPAPDILYEFDRWSDGVLTELRNIDVGP